MESLEPALRCSCYRDEKIEAVRNTVLHLLSEVHGLSGLWFLFVEVVRGSSCEVDLNTALTASKEEGTLRYQGIPRGTAAASQLTSKRLVILVSVPLRFFVYLFCDSPASCFLNQMARGCKPFLWQRRARINQECAYIF